MSTSTVSLYGRARRRCRAVVPYAALFMALVPRADAVLQPLLEEPFDVDPVAAGAARFVGAEAADRFTFSSGAATAAFDTSRASAHLLFPLGLTLTDRHHFRYTVDLTILANARFLADPDGLAQIAFGLINSDRTGLDRAGGSSGGGDAFDLVSVDYFPNVNETFGGPTLSPTVIASDTGAGYFGSIIFPFGAETDLTAEGPLPLDTLLRFGVDYDAARRVVTLSLPGADVNSDGQGGAGGPDGDAATVQNLLPADAPFAVNAFAITLWEDTWRPIPEAPTVRADVVFDRFTVHADPVPVPEPGSLGSVAVVLLMCASGRVRKAWRRHGRSCSRAALDRA